MARRSKQTPERVTAILNALRLGNTRTAAAGYAEVDRATFYRWLEADASFRDDVKKAEADAESRFLGQVAKAAADGTWTAAAWWLERRRPEHYAKRERVEMSGPDGGPIEHKDIDLDDHERRALRDAIARELQQREATPTP